MDSSTIKKMTTDLSNICEETCNSFKSFLVALQDVERMLQEEHAVKFVEEDIENTEDTEDEIIIEVKYLKDANDMMVIDSGAPVSLVSSNWLETYMRNMEMDDEGIERSEDNKRFRLSKTLYVSKEKVKFPILMKTDKDGLIKEEITVNIIDSDEVTFLCGEEMLVEWRMTLYFRRRKLGFEENKKEVPLIKESHLLVKLERGDDLSKNI